MNIVFKKRDQPMAFLVFADIDNPNEKFILTAPIIGNNQDQMRPFLEIFQTLRQEHFDKHFIVEGSGIIEIEELAQIIHVSRPRPRYGPASERVLHELLHGAMVKESLVHYQLRITGMKP